MCIRDRSGISRPLSTFNNVVFPEPLFPITAVKLPFSIETEIPSVSYTHLDVYKRQSMTFHKRRNAPALCISVQMI